MLSRLIQFSLSQRLLIGLLTLLLIGLGGRAAMNIAIDAFPDISPTQVKIIIKSPGMTPEEVESLITQPIEVELLVSPGSRCCALFPNTRCRRLRWILRKAQIFTGPGNKLPNA